MKPASLESAFSKLEAAATAGERCPVSTEHGGPLNRNHVAALAREGRIFIEISSRNWRQVTILKGPHAGARTASNPDPHARVYQTIGAEGRKVNGKLQDSNAGSRSQPSAPRPLTAAELRR